MPTGILTAVWPDMASPFCLQTDKRLHQLADQTTEFKWRIGSDQADALFVGIDKRLVAHFAIQIRHVTLTEAPQLVIIGAFQNQCQFVAAMGMVWHRYPRRDAQQTCSSRTLKVQDELFDTIADPFPGQVIKWRVQ